MNTKPCERSGCTVFITQAGKTPKDYASRRFCSPKCAAKHRYETTGYMPSMTPEQREAAGRKGGSVAGARKRRAAALRVTEWLAQHLPDTMTAGWSARDVARVKALIARAWNDGRTAERARLRMEPQWKQQKGQAA